jgi:hypothetical protein
MIDKDLEKPDDLEELRNLNIKETEGSREIQDTIPSHTSSSYNHPLKLKKNNLGNQDKFIGSELKNGIKGQLAKINIITHEGEKIGAVKTASPRFKKRLPRMIGVTL